jgi:hypothetical protein
MSAFASMTPGGARRDICNTDSAAPFTYRPAPALRVERVHGDAGPLLLDCCAPNAALRRGDQNRDFGRIAEAAAFVCGQLRVTARHSDCKNLPRVAAPEFAYRHDPGRQRAGLVGADNRGAAKRLDRQQAPHERMTCRHALHAGGERDRHDRRQAFRHGRDGERHGREQEFNER